MSNHQDNMGEQVEKFEEHDTTGTNENSQNEENNETHEEETEIGQENDSDNNNDVQATVSANEESTLQVKASEKRWPGWPGESVYRVLVPSHKVGALIGRKGDIIKKMSEESRARIKILNSPPGVPERIVLISAKEEPDVPIPPAMDGLFRVHKRITDGLDADSAVPEASSGSVAPTRLLVPGLQAATIIGKQGATIKSIQESSNCIVRVIENLPHGALHDDRVVEIQGEPVAMHKAVEMIATQLRKFLVDRGVVPLFELQMPPQNMPMQNMQRDPVIAGHQPWGPPPPQTYPPPNSGGGPPYGSNPPAQFMPHDSYYPPPDHHVPPPFEKQQPHYGISAYGRDAPPPPGGSHSSSGSQPLPPHSASSQVSTHHMQIPLSYADAVIGTAGASISYIRRASGATVTVQETRGVPGEMTVEIIGSAAQVQTAQQLIQNFMAEAAPPGSGAGPTGAVPASATPTQSNPGSVDPGYNSYSSYGAAYGSPPPGVGPTAPGAGGGYGSGYPTGYGY